MEETAYIKRQKFAYGETKMTKMSFLPKLKNMKKRYPENNGLISTGVILRRHNDPKIIETMDAWWNEVENFSKRDQMSFNYIAWKYNTPFSILDDYIRDNKYFKWRIHDHETNQKNL